MGMNVFSSILFPLRCIFKSGCFNEQPRKFLLQEIAGFLYLYELQIYNIN